jgi:hypothetical protein
MSARKYKEISVVAQSGGSDWAAGVGVVMEKNVLWEIYCILQQYVYVFTCPKGECHT